MRSRFRAFIDYMRFVYGSEWPLVAGIIGSLLAIAIGLWEDVLSREAVVIAGTAGTVISLIILIRDTLDVYQRWAGVELRFGGVRDSSAYFAGAQWTTTVNQQAPTDGYVELAGAGNGKIIERIWRDAAVDHTLWSNAGQVSLELRHSRYLLPDKLKNIAPRALRTTNNSAPNQSRNQRPIWFNGKLCRLMTEPTVEALISSQLSIQSVSFYDGQSSNELWP